VSQSRYIADDLSDELAAYNHWIRSRINYPFLINREPVQALQLGDYLRGTEPTQSTMPSTQFNFEEKYRYQNGFASYHE
jgi:hypothetical protein